MNPILSINDLLSNLTGNTAHYTAPAGGPVAAPYSVRGVPLTDKDLTTLRNVLFAEVSNRTPDKQ